MTVAGQRATADHDKRGLAAMPSRRIWSFGAALLSLMLVCVLPLAGLALFTIWRVGDSERSDTQREILSTAHVISNLTDQRLGDAERTLRALASLFPQDDGDMAEFYGDCRTLAAESGGWIAFIDGEGGQVFNTKRPLGTVLPHVNGNRELAAAIALRQPRISGLFTASVDPRPEFAVYVPVARGSQETPGVLAMVFPPTMLSDMLARQQLPPNWLVATVDQNGVIIATQTESDEFTGKAASPGVRDMPDDQTEALLSLTDLRHTPQYVGVVRSTRSGWKTIVGRPQAEADAPSRQSLQRFGILGACTLLVALGLAALIGRRLSGNMRSLAAAAHALGRQDPLPAIVSGVREILEVAGAFEQAETELVRREQQLRRSQQQLLHAERMVGMGSLDRNLKTGDVECSEGFCRVFGVDPKTFVPALDNILPLIHEEDRERVRTVTSNTRRGLKPLPLEFRIVRPDGAVRLIRREAEVTYDKAGEPARLFITVRDVTEQRAAEDHQRELEGQLLHTQKLEALGTLAGGVAHDLNNTLVPVVALTKLAMKRLPEESRDRANLATVMHAGERARDLVRQILAFSRKDTPTRQRIDLAALLRESLKMLRASIPATIAVDEHIADDIPEIYGDPTQLHQVVINLFVNAVQAIGKAMGKITVSLAADAAAPLPPDRLEPPRPPLRLSIRDSGCGMDEATLRRVFEPFFTTKPVGEGTGLGLSVVHGIVTRHDGQLAVESEPGRGTVFYVYLRGLPETPVNAADAA